MAQQTRKDHNSQKFQITAETNRMIELCKDSVRKEVKEFYDKTFKDNLVAYHCAKANLNEKICYAPNCKCIRTPIFKNKRVKQNNESFVIRVKVHPPKLYVFCHSCASVLCPGPSWRS